jgi:hypothetical protein
MWIVDHVRGEWSWEKYCMLDADWAAFRRPSQRLCLGSMISDLCLCLVLTENEGEKNFQWRLT